jgi:2-amino-4-hydroxy-6-hydroxymethyldihydropteridine diphosphokinase
MSVTEKRAFLSLGSNIGNRLQQLQNATLSIGEFAELIRVSSVYETAPVGPIRQNDFLNIVLEIQTSLTPQDLMIHLMHVEENLGRRRNIKWGPRSIDIDILFYDRLILNASGLVIPHARYAERRFVLEPLCEIAPDWICPVRNKTVKEICDGLADPQKVKKIDDVIYTESTEHVS